MVRTLRNWLRLHNLRIETHCLSLVRLQVSQRYIARRALAAQRFANSHCRKRARKPSYRLCRPATTRRLEEGALLLDAEGMVKGVASSGIPRGSLHWSA